MPHNLYLHSGLVLVRVLLCHHCYVTMAVWWEISPGKIFLELYWEVFHVHTHADEDCLCGTIFPPARSCNSTSVNNV